MVQQPEGKGYQHVRISCQHLSNLALEQVIWNQLNNLPQTSSMHTIWDWLIKSKIQVGSLNIYHYKPTYFLFMSLVRARSIATVIVGCCSSLASNDIMLFVGDADSLPFIRGVDGTL